MTYSIVARDPGTGELGVATQSHFFAVGAVVPWARPGVGAVATQATAEPSYGPRGLELMADGVSAPRALAQLRAADPGAASRQVAMVSADGEVGALTGDGCIDAAGDVQGDAVSCQGNILVDDGVWPAMLDAFVWESGSLPRRLLAALRGAQAAGGDLRGVQSAALLVVPAIGAPWETVVSLRVDDSSDPLSELERLLGRAEAYALVSSADDLAAAGRHAEAADAYRRAAALVPDEPELRFWGALGLAETGGSAGFDAALAELRSICAAEPRWREVLGRLGPDHAPAAARLAAAL